MARTEELWTNGIDQTYIKTSSPSGYDLLINGSNHYINFNTTTGTSGYGFRDNNGTMEFKNSGGSWAAFGGGGGSGTVTSIATAGLISGGTITTTGTITTSMATNKLVGRGTAGTGVMEEITLGTGLSLTGTTLNATAAITGADTQVLFFDGANNPTGEAGLTYDKTTDSLTMAGKMNSATANISSLTASKVVFTDASKNLTSTGIGAATDFIKGDGSLDGSTYLTGNQTIALTGDVSGTGSTAITTTINAGVVGIAMLSATGTPSATTFLRGDNTWATPAGSGTVTDVSVVSANGFAGTVATSTTTPAITLTTSITGLLKGNGTAISAASAGTDYTDNAFKTIAVSGQSDVVADSAADTLTLAAGSNITITTNATTDTITIAASGGGATAGINTTVSGTDVNALSDTINPAQITAWQNDYAPTSIGTASVVNLDADTSFPFITGITATGMSDGEIKIFNNDGSNPFGFKDSSTASTAGNRFEMGEDVILLPKRNVAFRYDATNTCWRLVGNSPDIPREYYSQDYANYMWQKTNDGIFNWWTSGSGASNALNTSTTFQSSRPGVVTSATGTTTSGYAQIFGADASDPNKVMTITKGYTEFNAMVYFDNLSDGTDTYTYKMGLVNAYSSSTGQTEEVTIVYSSGINSGKWMLRTQTGSVSTDVDSGVTVVADTWYHIKWVCYDGDRVDFWINGAYGGSSSTNISTNTMGPIHSIWKTAGTTSRTVDCDYFGFKAVNYTA